MLLIYIISSSHPIPIRQREGGPAVSRPQVELQEGGGETELLLEARMDIPRCVASLLKLQPDASEKKDADDRLGQPDAPHIDHHLTIRGSERVAGWIVAAWLHGSKGNAFDPASVVPRYASVRRAEVDGSLHPSGGVVDRSTANPDRIHDSPGIARQAGSTQVCIAGRQIAWDMCAVDPSSCRHLGVRKT